MQTTKRGVLYVGHQCNLNCRFCYYKHLPVDKRKWFGLAQCLKQAQQLRIWYGNQFVDITGGEPTIYPYITELVSHCRSIGLRTSLITNAQALADMELCVDLKKAGAHDFLVSIQGVDDVYDDMVGVPGAASQQLKALSKLRRL